MKNQVGLDFLKGGMGMSKAAAARAKLLERMDELIDFVIDNAVKAQEAGEFDVAAKSVQWLIEHMPADSSGLKPIDASVDKQPKETGKLGGGAPRIQIGIALGNPKKLPPSTQVVEVEPVEVEEDEDE